MLVESIRCLIRSIAKTNTFSICVKKMLHCKDQNLIVAYNTSKSTKTKQLLTKTILQALAGIAD